VAAEALPEAQAAIQEMEEALGVDRKTDALQQAYNRSQPS
jgi:hypothetical protein